MGEPIDKNEPIRYWRGIVAIDVTQDDIDRGEPKICSTCPVALAISRKFPRVRISVSLTDVCFGSIEQAQHFASRLDRSVSKWIDDFDNDFIVMPFSFDLWVDQGAIKSLGRWMSRLRLAWLEWRRPITGGHP